MNTCSVTLYAYTFRSRAERIVWLLEELIVPYTLIRLNPLAGETRSKEFLAINPDAKVPVLVHNGQIYTESLAIMEYIACEFDGTHLLPNNSADTYMFRQALSYGSTEVETYLWLAEQSSHLNKRYKWPEGTYARAISMAKTKIMPCYTWLQQRTYIAGAAFTLADMYYYHLFSWFDQLTGCLPTEARTYMRMLEQRPRFPACVKNSDAIE